MSLDEVPVRTRGDEIWVVIPGEDLITTEVSIPTRNRRRLMQAIPYALEDRLTEDVDELHFVLLAWKPGRSATVGILSRRGLRECLQVFASRNLKPSAMVAEYQLLPMHPRTRITISDHGDGRTSMLRADGTGATLDTDNVELWWGSLEGDRPPVAVNHPELAQRLMAVAEADIRIWEVGGDFRSWLRHRSRREPLVDLLPAGETGDRQPQSVPGLRVAMVLMCLAVLGRITVDGYEYMQLEAENDRLGTEIATLFRSTFPEEQRIVNARSQFGQKLMEMTRGADAAGDFQVLLSVVASAIAGTAIGLHELSFRENTLEVVCAVENFTQLDLLQQQFSQPGIAVELVGSGALDERVTGRFRLTRGGG